MPLSKTNNTMKRKVTIFLASIAIFAAVYYLAVYVHILLGAIATGLGINILEHLTKGVE